jgi:predicted nucleic acid-binding protein
VIIVDSSLWIDHLRASSETLSALIERKEVLVHPFVIGEIALGVIRSRTTVLDALRKLPGVPVARHIDVMQLIEQYRLFGRGIGYIDTHLLAAARLQPGTMLWTRDRRLLTVADELGLAAYPIH